VDGPVLGIDLGTTNSVVAVADPEPRVLPDPEGYNLIPSVVSFHPGGEILVGRTARDRRLLDAKNTVYSVKRLIGRPFRSPEVHRAQERFPFELREGPTGGVLVAARSETYTLSEISAFVLRQVRTVAEQALGMTCTRAVVTVPANFNELQRSATKAAGRVAGLDVLRILNEPTAAALAYGYGRGARERIAIYDLGGGTFDLTLLELSGEVFEVLATAGDTYLGGDDVDVLVADQMAAAFLEHHRYDAKQDAQAYERLRAAAEWAKCQLSVENEVQLRVEELAYGEGGASLDLTFGLSRQTLERLAQPLVARTFDVCEDAMRVAGIRPTQLDNVILVGGSTRIPLVQRMVAEYFGRQPLQNIDPDLVVAKGASIQGTALTAPAERRALGRVRLKKLTQQELQAIAINRARSEQPPPPPRGRGQDGSELRGVRRRGHRGEAGPLLGPAAASASASAAPGVRDAAPAAGLDDARGTGPCARRRLRPRVAARAPRAAPNARRPRAARRPRRAAPDPGRADGHVGAAGRAGARPAAAALAARRHSPQPRHRDGGRVLRAGDQAERRDPGRADARVLDREGQPGGHPRPDLPG
jgi:molecular chaperone DnaK